MSETKSKYAEKRLIHLSKEQEEKIASQKHQMIQNFVNELNQVQSRRFELGSALMISQAQYGGVESVDVEGCRMKAQDAVDADAKQKWAGLKSLFAEMGVRGPIPALEWAAKQCGVTLFDPLPEAPLVEVAKLDIESLSKVIQ